MSVFLKLLFLTTFSLGEAKSGIPRPPLLGSPEVKPNLPVKKLIIFDQAFCSSSIDCCAKIFHPWLKTVWKYEQENDIEYKTPIQSANFFILSAARDIGSFVCVDGRDWNGKSLQEMGEAVITKPFYLRADANHQLEKYWDEDETEFPWAVKGRCVPRNLPLDPAQAAKRTKDLNMNELQMAAIEESFKSLSANLDFNRELKIATNLINAYLTRVQGPQDPGAGGSAGASSSSGV